MNFYLLYVFTLLLIEATAKPSSRIIGGTDAEIGQFPYAAAINVQTTDSTFFCGGTLMRSQWIFTSGHCVYNAVLFTIQLASVTLTEADPNRIVLNSTEYYIHPDFNPDTIEADVGLIKLGINISATEYVQSALFHISNIPGSAPFTVVGWGQTSDSKSDFSEHLQYVEITTLSNEDCKKIYGNQITDNMVCAEGNANEGTCTGDNGGALLQKAANGYFVVGVASFISSNGCESTNPSGFTRIYTYYRWVSDTMMGRT